MIFRFHKKSGSSTLQRIPCHYDFNLFLKPSLWLLLRDLSNLNISKKESRDWYKMILRHYWRRKNILDKIVINEKQFIEVQQSITQNCQHEEKEIKKLFTTHPVTRDLNKNPLFPNKNDSLNLVPNRSILRFPLNRVQKEDPINPRADIQTKGATCRDR